MQPVSNTKKPFSLIVLKAFVFSGVLETPSVLILKDQSRKTPSFSIISFRISATVLLADRFTDRIAFRFVKLFFIINFTGDTRSL